MSALAFILPLLVQRIVYSQLDKRLHARQEKVLRMIRIGGLKEITLDQDCSFENYSIFKEEFVSISPLAKMPEDFGKTEILDMQRVVDNELIRHRVLSQAFIYDNQLYTIEIGEGLSSADALESTIRNFTLKLMLAVVLFSIFFDLGFAQILLRPFNKIVTGKLRNVRHPSSFNLTPVKSNTYEFRHLDEAINQMMGQIQEAFEVEREFITNVSHELLTPISILQNRVENLINDPDMPEEVVNKLAESQKTLVRLARVVRALLYISRIENLQYIKNETADLHAVIKDVIDEVDVLIQDKGLTLVTERLDEHKFYPCNLSLLHTLVFNLLSNAVKYNVPGGNITVEGRSENNGYTLEIADSGIGIANEQLSSIFDRFKRLHPEKETGFGLGLPIVQSIAEFHQVHIEVSSEPGRGTSFVLHFPPSVSA